MPTLKTILPPIACVRSGLQLIRFESSAVNREAMLESCPTNTVIFGALVRSVTRALLDITDQRFLNIARHFQR